MSNTNTSSVCVCAAMGEKQCVQYRRGQNDQLDAAYGGRRGTGKSTVIGDSRGKCLRCVGKICE